MNDALLYYWHWFIAALVVFTLLGYAGLMLGHGQEHRHSGPKSGLVRKNAGRKEKSR